MKHPVAIFLAVLLLFFGTRLTWLMSESAHYLTHQGAFDAVIGFVLLLLAPCPFLICLLMGLVAVANAANDDDGGDGDTSDYP